MRPAPLARLATLLALATGSACGGVPGAELGAGPPPLSEAGRDFYARRSLEDARRFVREGRFEPAERALRRGLAVKPDDPQLHAALARVLTELDRAEVAARHRSRADALAPPPPPPPDAPLELPSRGLLVVLLPPEADAQRTLEARLRVRLPDAERVFEAPESVPDARAWLSRRPARAVLSLRVDRATCDDTVKDGPFALARLRVSAAARGGPAGISESIREIVVDPRLPGGCENEAVARALESALARPAVREALAAAPPADARWTSRALRALFPGIGRRVEERLAEGRRLLAAGELEAAAEAFRRARAIDPDDPDVRSYLGEAESTLELARELSGGGDERLDPRRSAAQRASDESLLAEERRRRESLLAAVAVLDEDVRAPAPEVLARLPAARQREPDAFGPRMARSRAGGAVVVRAAYAPDGSEIARYYFPEGGDSPVLREEDTGDDGRPDRWIAYAGRARSDVWEDGRGSGRPDLHLVFAPGGLPLERLEVDGDLDGRPERIFQYEAGRLQRESRDTDGDGLLDRFDSFDAQGNVSLRKEDLDGDGLIDVRSEYEEGRLVRRQLADPDLAPDT